MDRLTQMTSAETVSAPSGAPPASVSAASHASIADEGRFVSGTLLAGRYRIVGLLGKGGMGEVYRATDLTLGQSVALKFLPHAARDNPFLLERFHAEVRIARQISHPNVCRVYDIGEVDGMPFISMEYIDGEDLASLLPRIGRLPADKAVETARKICAGLAAAHAKGVIHRDLKPHNIMLNKRGEIVVMDFGLAAVASQLSGAEAKNGTPAYMSPEQLKGAEVTSRSDIYALGLVLYELFTGRRPYEAKNIAQLIQLQEAAQLTSMTSIAADIDPAVENVIRRCLDPDPAKRPETALLVSAALPGGDPLAAALAAGETPSPELVAASGKTEGMPIRYALACLAAVIVCVLTVPFLKQHKTAFLQIASDYPPDVLRQKGRDIAASFGYARRPADTALWLDQRLDLLTFLNLHPPPRPLVQWLNAEAPVSATYREALSPLIAPPDGEVTAVNPPVTEPGMTRAELDVQGRLRGFLGVPPDRSPSGVPPPVDSVFQAAQLDRNAFQEVPPVTIPPVPADSLRAWQGVHPSIPGLAMHIEIASWQGRITYVDFRWPWTRGGAPEHFNAWIARAQQVLFPLLAGLLLIFTTLLARRNWTLGRGDKFGAFKVGLALFTLILFQWACSVHAVPAPATLEFFMETLRTATFNGVFYMMLYLALEPAVRSRWPQALVTWNRALAGRWKDPRLASDILIGTAVGAVMIAALLIHDVLLAPRYGFDTAGGLYLLNGARFWLAGVLGRVETGISEGLLIFFAIFILRTVLRRDWVAALAGALIFTVQEGDLANALDWRIESAVYVILFTVLILMLLRLGLVVTITAMFALNLLNSINISPDWSAWYVPSGLAVMALAIALALGAFRRALGDRDLFGAAGSES